ncbi:putative germin-like protein 2-1 [Phtheirospermum japonicum]|uniref:Germin-like protein n=1 Tax=Phtheirospermum japonicum TaxID=374723 RepID=A0A830C0C4_9LAMI|nr:putative germin-like protein 2-1 [Phtheirospermum japonicum]
MATPIFLLSTIVALNFLCIAIAFDPWPFQYFCVADPTSLVRVNGLPLKDPKTAKADDFFFSSLHLPDNTSNRIGAALTSVNVASVPGLNTLGLTLACLDLPRHGFIPPHYHPRATEVITVLLGHVEVGFVESGSNRTYYRKSLKMGDVFVLSVGLPHYFRNVAWTNTVALAVVNNQNAGIIMATQGIFGAEPPINAGYLAKAYLLDQKTIHRLEAAF